MDLLVRAGTLTSGIRALDLRAMATKKSGGGNPNAQNQTVAEASHLELDFQVLREETAAQLVSLQDSVTNLQGPMAELQKTVSSIKAELLAEMRLLLLETKPVQTATVPDLVPSVDSSTEAAQISFGNLQEVADVITLPTKETPALPAIVATSSELTLATANPKGPVTTSTTTVAAANVDSATKGSSSKLMPLLSEPNKCSELAHHEVILGVNNEVNTATDKIVSTRTLNADTNVVTQGVSLLGDPNRSELIGLNPYVAGGTSDMHLGGGKTGLGHVNSSYVNQGKMNAPPGTLVDQRCAHLQQYTDFGLQSCNCSLGTIVTQTIGAAPTSHFSTINSVLDRNAGPSYVQNPFVGHSVPSFSSMQGIQHYGTYNSNTSQGAYPPTSVLSLGSTTLAISGISTNSIEGVSANSISGSNKKFTYRELGHNEVILGLKNDVFPHLNDAPLESLNTGADLSSVALTQPCATTIVGLNIIRPSSVGGTFVMNMFGGRSDVGHYWQVNSAVVNSGRHTTVHSSTYVSGVTTSQDAVFVFVCWDHGTYALITYSEVTNGYTIPTVDLRCITDRVDTFGMRGFSIPGPFGHHRVWINDTICFSRQLENLEAPFLSEQEVLHQLITSDLSRGTAETVMQHNTTCLTNVALLLGLWLLTLTEEIRKLLILVYSYPCPLTSYCLSILLSAIGKWMHGVDWMINTVEGNGMVSTAAFLAQSRPEDMPCSKGGGMLGLLG